MIEEIGKAVSGVTDALKNQPFVFALVLLQALVLVAVLYNSIHRQSAISKQFTHVYELLETCLKGEAPQQRGDLRLLMEPIPLPPPRPRPPEPPP